MLTRSYVGSRYEYRLRLSNNLVRVVSPDGDLDGSVKLVFDQDDALLYPDQTVPSEDTQELLTVVS